jgi:hypothetical protein
MKTLLVLVALVALVILPVTYSLSCITVNNAYKTLDQFDLGNLNLDDFKQAFKELPANSGEDQCRVSILINYVDQSMYVEFTNLLKTSKLAIGEVEFNTVIWFDQNGEIQHKNQLEYVCSDNDTCEKQFLFDHVAWLLKLNYTDLVKHSASLLIGKGDTPGKLYDSRDENNLIFNATNYTNWFALFPFLIDHEQHTH